MAKITEMPEECEDMDMPVPCQKCGEWFELNDGSTSEKWFPNTVICSSCGNAEEMEIERDNEIAELKEGMEDALLTMRKNRNRLKELGSDFEFIHMAAMYFDDKITHTHQPDNIKTGFVVYGYRHQGNNTLQGFLISSVTLPARDRYLCLNQTRMDRLQSQHFQNLLYSSLIVKKAKKDI